MKSTFFAPASVANVAIGFDCLGFSLPELGDRVTARLKGDAKTEVSIVDCSDNDLPKDPQKNTAGVAALKVLEHSNTKGHLELSIHKGIPRCSGLGGSAASSVAAALATNDVIGNKLTQTDLLPCILAGEAVASGDEHYDNILPCLKGGFGVCTKSGDFLKVVSDQFHCVVVHPNLTIETKKARQSLPNTFPASLVFEQLQSSLVSLTALQRNDFRVLKEHFQDLLVSPNRKNFIPGFDELQKFVNESTTQIHISGAGPTVFALSATRSAADAMARAICDFWNSESIDSQAYISTLNQPGAHKIAMP